MVANLRTWVSFVTKSDAIDVGSFERVLGGVVNMAVRGVMSIENSLGIHFRGQILIAWSK
jgi:hypothetical protein